MKKYLFIFLACLIILQGCNWFEGKRGRDGKTGIAGILGPANCDSSLTPTPTPQELIYLINTNSPVCFEEYLSGLGNQKWQGTIIDFDPFNKQLQVDMDGEVIIATNFGTTKFKEGELFNEEVKILRVTRYAILVDLLSTDPPVFEIAAIN